MPIFIRNYEWKQSAEKIHITVPLKDVQASRLQSFINEKYIKLNFAQYIFEIVLSGSIQSTKSKCVVKKGEVILELTKKDAGLWSQLSEDIDKKELVEVKEEIIKEEQKFAALEKENRKKLKSEQTHFLRDYQMLVNREERQKIQSLKDEQKASAVQELMTWKTDRNHQRNTNQKKNFSDENEVSLPIPIPFPRNNGVITFSFTPRVLPTPKRESKTREEEEWLRKQAEAIGSSGFVSANLNEDERDPIWLLNTGMNFFKNTNYLGALNAFEYAIKISPKMPILYVKLAHTLLKLGHFPKAVDKATIALELLVPAVRRNQNLRSEAFRIRGEAYKSIGEEERSSADYRKSELLKL